MPLRLCGLDKRYESKQILHRFSLELPAAGVVAILGPSGGGKTTLLRLIAGLELPDGGKIIREPGERVSMVFQEDRLLDALTARENVAIVLPREKQEKADYWLREFGLWDARGQYPPTLSGGMKRRVALARAMAYDGQQLLLDEPFRGLDIETRARVMKAVFANSKERLTLFVTHDPAEAVSVADRILRTVGPPLHIVEELSPGGEGGLSRRKAAEKLSADDFPPI